MQRFGFALATRIIDMTSDGIVDFRGTYEEYLRAQLSEKTKQVA